MMTGKTGALVGPVHTLALVRAALLVLLVALSETATSSVSDAENDDWVKNKTRFCTELSALDLKKLPADVGYYLDGECHQLGYGRPVDLEAAVRSYLAAAAKGVVAGYVDAAIVVLSAIRDPELFDDAVEWLETARCASNVRAEFYLALLYLTGRIVVHDVAKAEKMLESAARSGEAPLASSMLHYLYHGGEHGIPADPARAQRFAESAALENPYLVGAHDLVSERAVIEQFLEEFALPKTPKDD